MSERFDPYHQWLGIPPSEQPPTYYRLLGVSLFEADATVISNAADPQMASLRSYQSGKHAAESQRLLNEVASAKLCLLKAAKKDAYDNSLRARLAPEGAAAKKLPQAVAIDPQFLADLQKPKSAASSPERTPVTVDRRVKKKTRPNSKVIVVMAAAMLAAIAFAIWVISSSAPRQAAGNINGQRPPHQTAASAPSGSPSAVTPTKPASTGAKQSSAKVKTSDGQSASVKNPLPSRIVPENPRDLTAAAPPTADLKPEEQKAPATKSNTETQPQKPAHREKLILPSKEVRDRLNHEIDLAYPPDKATAGKLLQAGNDDDSNPDEQFVLFWRTAQIARDAGEVETMLQAVDAIVTAGFDINPYKVKSSLLQQLMKQHATDDAKSCSTIGASCVDFAFDAAANGAPRRGIQSAGDRAGLRPRLPSRTRPKPSRRQKPRSARERLPTLLSKRQMSKRQRPRRMRSNPL